MPKFLGLPPVFVVELYALRDGRPVRIRRQTCADAATAERLAKGYAADQDGVLAWARLPDAVTGDYGAPQLIHRSGIAPEPADPAGPR